MHHLRFFSPLVRFLTVFLFSLYDYILCPSIPTCLSLTLSPSLLSCAEFKYTLTLRLTVSHSFSHVACIIQASFRRLVHNAVLVAGWPRNRTVTFWWKHKWLPWSRVTSSMVGAQYRYTKNSKQREPTILFVKFNVPVSFCSPNPRFETFSHSV